MFVGCRQTKLLKKMVYQRCFIILVIISCLFIYQNNGQLGSSCRTPNGQTATCISIYNCSTFLSALPANIPSQLMFIKNSRCGLDKQPFVCCGSDVDYRNRTTVTLGRRHWYDSDTMNFVRNSLIPDRSSCGFQEPDKANRFLLEKGDATMINEFPWMALLGYTDNYGNSRWACGGTLINTRYILTAGHCVTGRILKAVGRLTSVKLGEHNTQTEIDCDQSLNCNSKPIIADVEEIIPHPNYIRDEDLRPYDIALVRLSQRITFSNSIRPICLSEPTEESKSRENLITAGWGKTEFGTVSKVLLKAEVPIIDKQRCCGIYSNLGINLVDSQICAGGEAIKDSCTGDSGGPLMRRSQSNPLQWYQEGLGSFGFSQCGTTGVPPVYTKIAVFLPWIHNMVRY